MIRVPVRSFQLKPYEYLKALPIMLTRYDKDVAVISTARQIIVKPQDFAPVEKDAYSIKLCKHGNPPGLCKFGCK